jgi:hypothetical protein
LLVFVFVPNSTEKAKKLCTFHCPLALRAAIFVFSCFIEFVFIIVVSNCWFVIMFLVCSTLLCAFGFAAHLIPSIQHQTDPLHSSVCPASRLVLILHVTSLRYVAKHVFEPFFPCYYLIVTSPISFHLHCFTRFPLQVATAPSKP